MDKHVSIYAVIPICRSDVLPYFSQKQERRSGNYLISVSNPVPIPDRRFPNCPENLNFRWSWFPIRSSFLCQIPVTRFPDNLCLRWSPIPIPISMLIPVSLFSRQFQFFRVLVVATALSDPVVVFLQSARNQQLSFPHVTACFADFLIL